MTRINAILHDYLAVVLLALMGLAGTAVFFYWTSQMDIISDVSANSTGVERNKELGDEVNGQLTEIGRVVNSMAVDMAVVKEQVSSLKKP